MLRVVMRIWKIIESKCRGRNTAINLNGESIWDWREVYIRE